MKKRLYLGTNTKMFMTASETERYLRDLGNRTKEFPRGETALFVIPSFTSLERAGEAARQGEILLGAQNMGWEERGAFTGEISPLMLREAGVDVVEIGHSERRHLFGETDAQENRKVLCALRHQFRVLLCVGETKEQKEYGITEEILRIQIKMGLKGVRPEEAGRVWVAYEPVWAIGESGIPADSGYASRSHAAIRQALSEQFGEPGKEIPVLYGGSVNRSNACGLIAAPEIDGLFIGRSAWDVQNFSAIIREVLPVWKSKGRA